MPSWAVYEKWRATRSPCSSPITGSRRRPSLPISMRSSWRRDLRREIPQPTSPEPSGDRARSIDWCRADWAGGCGRDQDPPCGRCIAIRRLLLGDGRRGLGQPQGTRTEGHRGSSRIRSRAGGGPDALLVVRAPELGSPVREVLRSGRSSRQIRCWGARPDRDPTSTGSSITRAERRSHSRIPPAIIDGTVSSRPRVTVSPASTSASVTSRTSHRRRWRGAARRLPPFSTAA